jgi:hypothetical protein
VTWSVAGVWGSETAEYKKDLDAPEFKSKGDIAGLASRFDTIQSKFTQNIDKKDKAKDIFVKGEAELDKIDKQWEAVWKRLDETCCRVRGVNTSKSQSGESRRHLKELGGGVKIEPRSN